MNLVVVASVVACVRDRQFQIFQLLNSTLDLPKRIRGVVSNLVPAYPAEILIVTWICVSTQTLNLLQIHLLGKAAYRSYYSEDHHRTRSEREINEWHPKNTLTTD